MAWKWLVRRTRESKPFFFAFATICGIVPGVIGYGVMTATNTQSVQLESKLRSKARPESLASRQIVFLISADHSWSQMMGQVNKERLAEYLGELQRKENTNDRYVAALRGETLTRKPYMILSGVSPSATYPVADPTAEENSQDRKVFTPNNTR
ncbi:hypothetical protein TSUD_367550 [Trifolium subterraneum]|uniref:Uncharacterized protein n=1 Tax=Trifolium subterraneum TaxID=3900 RepID=A0A2Z6NW86_TRISU|nr:hypothetical protein TSUD_367550 [Trifolium subterraneum]